MPPDKERIGRIQTVLAERNWDALVCSAGQRAHAVRLLARNRNRYRSCDPGSRVTVLAPENEQEGIGVAPGIGVEPIGVAPGIGVEPAFLDVPWRCATMTSSDSLSSSFARAVRWMQPSTINTVGGSLEDLIEPAVLEQESHHKVVDREKTYRPDQSAGQGIIVPDNRV